MAFGLRTDVPGQSAKSSGARFAEAFVPTGYNASRIAVRGPKVLASRDAPVTDLLPTAGSKSKMPQPLGPKGRLAPLQDRLRHDILSGHTGLSLCETKLRYRGTRKLHRWQLYRPQAPQTALVPKLKRGRP